MYYQHDTNQALHKCLLVQNTSLPSKSIFKSVHFKLRIKFAICTYVLNFSGSKWAWLLFKMTIHKVRHNQTFLYHVYCGLWPLHNRRKLGIVKYWLEIKNANNFLLKDAYENMLVNNDYQIYPLQINSYW